MPIKLKVLRLNKHKIIGKITKLCENRVQHTGEKRIIQKQYPILLIKKLNINKLKFKKMILYSRNNDITADTSGL